MKKVLEFLSLIITSLTLMYLLLVTILRNGFIASDWVVVSIDLTAKIIIESVILFQKK